MQGTRSSIKGLNFKTKRRCAPQTQQRTRVEGSLSERNFTLVLSWPSWSAQVRIGTQTATARTTLSAWLRLPQQRKTAVKRRVNDDKIRWLIVMPLSERKSLPTNEPPDRSIEISEEFGGRTGELEQIASSSDRERTPSQVLASWRNPKGRIIISRAGKDTCGPLSR